MNRKNVLIVEDDFSAMEMLKKLVKEIDGNVNCFGVVNKSQAYEILHEKLIDVFLIDIILNTSIPDDVSGLELAEEIREIERYKFTPIIFITSMEDPKMYAYKTLHSFDYIEKPYMVKETKKTIAEALHYKTENKNDKVLLFRKDGILIPVEEKQIIYIKFKTHMSYVYTEKEEIAIPYKNCDEMLKVLDNEFFVKCNRSTIVNRKYIAKIDRINRYILFNDEFGCERISIGKKYFDKVIQGMVIC